MRRSSKRIAASTAAALAVVGLALLATATAGARDGHGRDDGSRAVEVRGHDQERQAGRDDARRKGDENEVEQLLSSSLAPSVPTDPAIHGVAAGGLPWVLDRGRVRLRSDGRIRVTLKGLVIPVAHGAFPAGTARPVATVTASLYCAPDGSAAAATTASAPISEGGDATIADTIDLPATCLAPVVLVHPNGSDGAYIAVTGSR